MQSEFPKEVPMVIRMRQALDHFKAMSPSDQLEHMIRAGIWTEQEVQEAIARKAARKTRITGPKSHKPTFHTQSAAAFLQRRKARLAKGKSPKPVARKTKKSTEEA